MVDFWEHHPENVELFYFLEIFISTGEKEEKKKKEEEKGNKEEDGWDARCWVSPERWFGLTLHITLFGVGGSGRSPVSPPTPSSVWGVGRTVALESEA